MLQVRRQPLIVAEVRGAELKGRFGVDGRQNYSVPLTRRLNGFDQDLTKPEQVGNPSRR